MRILKKYTLFTNKFKRVSTFYYSFRQLANYLHRDYFFLIVVQKLIKGFRLLRLYLSDGRIYAAWLSLTWGREGVWVRRGALKVWKHPLKKPIQINRWMLDFFLKWNCPFPLNKDMLSLTDFYCSSLYSSATTIEFPELHKRNKINIYVGISSTPHPNIWIPKKNLFPLPSPHCTWRKASHQDHK